MLKPAVACSSFTLAQLPVISRGRIIFFWQKELKGIAPSPILRIYFHTQTCNRLINRYSAADISVVVRDALMQPIRKFISATHFKPVLVGVSEDTDLVKWTPCTPGEVESDAVEKSWVDLRANELLEPTLKLDDLVKSLETVRPTVSTSDIQRHEEWTKAFGRLPSYFLTDHQCSQCPTLQVMKELSVP